MFFTLSGFGTRRKCLSKTGLQVYIWYINPAVWLQFLVNTKTKAFNSPTSKSYEIYLSLQMSQLFSLKHDLCSCRYGRNSLD